MGRPRINPLLRYDFEISMWRTAITKGSAAYTCTTIKEAIHLNHRLNMARAAMRDESPNAYLDWDLFVARNSGNTVTISQKREFDITKITDGDGNPLTANDWQKIQSHTIETSQRAITPTLGGGAKPPPKTFDPDKPLDLDVE